MAERRLRKIHCRGAMHISNRTKRGLASWPAIDKPLNAFPQRQHVGCGKLSKEIVWMLAIDQRRAMVGFARLEELWKASVGRGERLRGEHLAKQNASTAKPVFFHEHCCIHGFQFADATRDTFAIKGEEQVGMDHQGPRSSILHPCPVWCGKRRPGGAGGKLGRERLFGSRW